MEITQQADYAVRAILDLALRPNGERTSCEEIARRQSIPVHSKEDSRPSSRSRG